MNKLTKAGITLAAVGGSLLMAAPMAFASQAPYDPTGAQLSAGVSAQWQNGSDASGTVMDQNSSISTGQLQASNYYNSNWNDGGVTTSNQYTAMPFDGNELTSSQSTTSYGGSSWTKATNYVSQGASVTQSQSQIINASYCNDDGFLSASGGRQAQASAAISGAIDGDANIAGGAAGSVQTQKGNWASQASLNQTSNVNAGDTQAKTFTTDSNSNGSSSFSNQYTGGTLVNAQAQKTYKSSTYTSAQNLSNPTAGASQDQNQVIGYAGSGGKQGQASGALTGQVTDEFWHSLG
ncbi:MAG: hypothetical protein K6T78_04245 [Alicyclobacillus sp.]|nr:hypothetical protein [Alicyclobacillus sp.]